MTKFWVGVMCGGVLACAMAVVSAPPVVAKLVATPKAADAPVGQTMLVTCTAGGGMSVRWAPPTP